MRGEVYGRPSTINRASLGVLLVLAISSVVYLSWRSAYAAQYSHLAGTQGTLTFDFGLVTAACADSSAITVTGATLGAACIVGTAAAWEANVQYSCYVSAADTVKVRFCSPAATINPSSQNFTVRVFNP